MMDGKAKVTYLPLFELATMFQAQILTFLRGRFPSSFTLQVMSLVWQTKATPVRSGDVWARSLLCHPKLISYYTDEETEAPQRKGECDEAGNEGGGDDHPDASTAINSVRTSL